MGVGHTKVARDIISELWMFHEEGENVGEEIVLEDCQKMGVC